LDSLKDEELQLVAINRLKLTAEDKRLFELTLFALAGRPRVCAALRERAPEEQRTSTTAPAGALVPNTLVLPEARKIGAQHGTEGK